jgi:hypothetical protein
MTLRIEQVNEFILILKANYGSGTEIPRCRSISMKSLVAYLRILLLLQHLPLNSLPNNRNFSPCCFPASGWDMMANVLLFSISEVYFIHEVGITLPEARKIKKFRGMTAIFLRIDGMIAVSLVQYVQRQNEFPLVWPPPAIIRIKQVTVTNTKAQRQFVPPFCVQIYFQTCRTVPGLDTRTIGSVKRNRRIIIKTLALTLRK